MNPPFFNPIATSSSAVSFLENITIPGLNPGVSRSPWQDFVNDGGAYSALTTGTATYVFGALSSAFSLVWGSPDAYNSLSFYNGATLVDTVLGADVLAGSGSATANGNRVNSLISIVTDAAYDTVVFRSSGNLPAFEYSFVSNAAPIPLPAGGLLLLGGLAGLAALRRRKSV